PVIADRDELYAKLPPIPDTLLARLQDCAQRGEAGIDCNIPMKQVIDDVALWSTHDAPAGQCITMSQQVRSILLDKMGGGGGGGGGYRTNGKGGGYGNRGNTPNVNTGGQMTGAGYGGGAGLPAKYSDRVAF